MLMITLSRSTSPRKILLQLFALCAIVAVAGGCGSNSRKAGTADSKASTSKIWKVGDHWTVTVTQNSSIAAPAGASGTEGTSYDQVYRFRVADAPTKKSPLWRVHATLDGVEGPLANGFSLWYAQQPDKSMKLDQVAIGTEHPSDPAAASAIFGQAFPLDTTITKPPTDRKVKAAQGGAGTGDATLPPPVPGG